MSVDNTLATSIEADGIIIATPTGSTAYSLSAGGIIAPPTVSGIFVTPICPHSLSMRPIMLPASSELKFQIPCTGQCATVSFDGRNRMDLEVGDYIVVTSSKYPLPSINMHGTHKEWFNSIKCKLGWNVKDIKDIKSIKNGEKNGNVNI